MVQERVVGGLKDSELIEVVMGRELWLGSVGRKLASQVESGRGRVSGRFWLASSQHRGSAGLGGRKSLDIGNIDPFPQSLTVIVKIQITLRSRVPLGSRLDWLSKGY